MTTPRVHCEMCNGTGRRPLTDCEEITLAAVTGEWQPLLKFMVALKAERVRPTALNNRLARLVKLGLVQSRPMPGNRRQKEWRLRAAEVARAALAGEADQSKAERRGGA